MENLDIRLMVSECGLQYKDIARKMKITPEYLSRMLRTKLSVKDRVRIIDTVLEMKEASKT